jgi:hypothetical protein
VHTMLASSRFAGSSESERVDDRGCGEAAGKEGKMT